MRGLGIGSRSGWMRGYVAATMLALASVHSLSAAETDAGKGSVPRQESGCKPGETTTYPAKFVIRNYAIRVDGCLVYFDATYAFMPPPKIVPGIENAVVVAGEYMTESSPQDFIALDKNGIVYTIPHGCVVNEKYEATCKVMPARRVDGLPPITFISSYEGAHLAVDRQGEVWGWGENDAGQVGPKAAAPWRIAKPTRLSLPTIMQTVSVSQSSSTGLDINGRVWFWGGYPEGTNYLGERFEWLIRNEIPSGKIHQISKGFRVIEIEALPPARQILGDRVLARDGSLWTWGTNFLAVNPGQRQSIGSPNPYLLVRSRSITRLDGDCNYNNSLFCVIFLEDSRIFRVGPNSTFDEPALKDEFVEIAASDQTCLGTACMVLRPFLLHVKDRSFISQIRQISHDCFLLQTGRISCRNNFVH